MTMILEKGYRPTNKLNILNPPGRKPNYMSACAKQKIETDLIDQPDHYLVGGIEVDAVCKAKLTKDEYRGWLKGNIIKYVLRAPWKESDQERDLRKTARYGEMLKNWLQQEKGNNES